ncbi:MAG: acyloxyacyl hydrolase [Bacteroides sp.]|nr:acyloxyacyl hydrolase [Bacteroides sp.]
MRSSNWINQIVSRMGSSLRVIFLPRVCLGMLSVVTAFAMSAAATADGDLCTVGRRFIHHLGMDVRGGYVSSARKAVAEVYSGSPERRSDLSAHLKYSFSYSGSTRLGRLYPGAYQGIGVGATSFFDSRGTGTPVTAYLFQSAPVFRVARNLTFDYEWNFGASFGWKKYDGINNPLNLIVGSPVNAYINLGFMLSYRLGDNWDMVAGVDLTHYSNGNTSLPNPGVNAIGGRLGVRYTIGGERKSTLTDRVPAVDAFRPHLSYDLVVYGAVRKKVADLNGAEVLPGRFGIAGLNFAPMHNFNRFLRAGVSLDVQWDESSDLHNYWVEGTYGDEVKFYRPPFFHQVSCGLSARGELVMPIFAINAGMGYNVIGNSDSKNFYQVLALKIHVAKSLYLHIGYQLNSFKNPNNLMIGVGYRFHDLR